MLHATAAFLARAARRHGLAAVAAVAARAVLLLAGASCLVPGCVKPAPPPLPSAIKPKAVDRYVLGVQAYRAGKNDQALDDLTAASRDNPDLVMARSILGDLHKERGEYQLAIEQYLALTRLDPYESNNHYRLGVSYQLVRELRSAARSYENALKLSPDDWRSHMNLGMVHLSLGERAAAQTDAQRAVELNSDSPVALANLGVVLDSNGRYVEAERAYRRSLELDSSAPATAMNLAGNLIVQKKPADAVTVLRELIRRSDLPAARKRLGDALSLSGELAEAMEHYEAALTRDDKYYPAMNAIGQLHIAQFQKGLLLDESRRAAALAAWTKSLAIRPAQPAIAALLKKWNR